MRARPSVAGGLASLAVAWGLVSDPGRLGAREQSQQPTFRSVVDSVMVDVSVRDGSTVVTNLLASDFRVLDNGVAQDVATAVFGQVPIDVTVVLDVSFSERGRPLARQKDAVLQLSSDLARGDRLRLIAFNDVVHRVLDFTANPSSIAEGVRGLSADGGTAILDALATAMVAPRDPERRQLVTIFTDGGDTTSTTEPSQVLEMGRRLEATVTAVTSRSSVAAPAVVLRPDTLTLVDSPSSRPGPRVSEYLHLISSLTNLTGGIVIPDPGAPADLGPSFRRALETFRSSYVLFFVPRGVNRPGFHTLTVSVPSHAGYAIRARTGYFGS